MGVDFERSLKMDIRVRIPDTKERIPTQLRLQINENIDVVYKRSPSSLAYEFSFLKNQVFQQQAYQLTTELADILCEQSYDHGSEWRVTATEQIFDMHEFDIYYTFKVHFRIKDSY